jgi:uncharacterized protein (TIGR00369 family)
VTGQATLLEPLARQWIEGVIAESPVAKALGVEVVALEVDLVRMRVPYDDQLTTVPGTVHGGVIATLIDIAGAAASASGVATDDGATGGATSHLSVTYLARASGDLTAEARVVHRSRSMTQSEVSVHGADGRLVATGQVSSRIFH